MHTYLQCAVMTCDYAMLESNRKEDGSSDGNDPFSGSKVEHLGTNVM